MESILPEWVPNIHPMVVHFPIALLFCAVLADILALIFRTRTVLARLATVLFLGGTVTLFVVFLTGRAAADSVMVSGVANTVLTDHADWATLTLWYFGVYALLRLVLWRLHFPAAVWIPVAAIGAGGLGLIVQSSHLGARLVFEQGVGVSRVSQLESDVAVLERELAQLRGESSVPVIEANGSWDWTPDAFAKEAFEQMFSVLAGQLTAGAMQDSMTGAQYLTLTPVESPVLAVFDVAISSVEFELDLDVSRFDGSVRIAHHVLDVAQYDFMELEGGNLRIGRTGNSGDQVFDDQPFIPSGMTEFSVVCDQTHFRAYADGVLIAHGHGLEAPPSPVGIVLNGSGTVLVGAMRAEALR